MLKERLIFGTARLSGGAYAPLARRLIALCLDAGITAFDTAPSYGMGAAERMLGKVLAGRTDVRIATKVGAPRPRWPGLRGWAKRGRRLVVRPHAPPAVTPLPYQGPAAGYRFDSDAVRASIQQSLAALRRDRADLLLLHEARPEAVPAAAAVLEGMLASGVAGAIGFAHGGLGDPPPPGWTAQLAPAPADFVVARSPSVPLVFHSIRVAATTLAAGAAADRIAALEAMLGPGDAGTRGYAAALLALHRTHPDAGLIVATTEPERLRALLTLIDLVEREGLDR